MIHQSTIMCVSAEKAAICLEVYYTSFFPDECVMIRRSNLTQLARYRAFNIFGFDGPSLVMVMRQDFFRHWMHAVVPSLGLALVIYAWNFGTPTSGNSFFFVRTVRKLCDNVRIQSRPSTSCRAKSERQDLLCLGADKVYRRF